MHSDSIGIKAQIQSTDCNNVNDTSPQNDDIVPQAQTLRNQVTGNTSNEFASKAKDAFRKRSILQSTTKRDDESDIHENPLYGYAEKHFVLRDTRPSSFICFKVRRTPLRLEKRLCWEKGMLQTPLLDLSKEHTRIALQAFRNISGFMGTRTSGKDKFDHCDKLLRNIMPRSDNVKDEIFCQICKQINGNPNHEAKLSGWLLLHICIATFTPSTTLYPFLERLLYTNIGSTHIEISQRATAALNALHNLSGKADRKELPTRQEITSVQQLSSIEIPISLVDGSTLQIAISSWTTCAELNNMVADQLGVVRKEFFALYEVSTQSERLIEAEERIVDMVSLWDRILCEKADKKPRQSNDKVTLLYKTYLFVTLDNDSNEEINLYYAQAVHDILTSTYVCPLENCIKLAAYQLHCNVGRNANQRLEHILMRDIHLYMPPNMISIANTKSIVLQILKFYESIQNWSIQQVKLAYLSTCEKLKLYGSTFFSLTNTRVRRFRSIWC